MQHKQLERFVMDQPNPWARIAAAAIVSALKDAARGDAQTLAWISDTGTSWIHLLGLDAHALAAQLAVMGRVLEDRFQ